ncbi:MAG TPA: sugar phosphate isomerase/epimerase family protein [Gemmatimonadaceae bacterium]|nr:sugar phosphate isomerase/epimerase family protein [Gemmatimonadaceae bacterium]
MGRDYNGTPGMKLAISNLAWDSKHDAAVAALMQSRGIRGVEIAPTKIWADPLEAPESEIDDYRQFWKGFGIEIVSLQSLLYGRPDLKLFGSKDERAELLDYLKRMIDLAARLGPNGIGMVFGSPKNRLKGNLSDDEAMETAVPLFRSLGQHAAFHDVTFCIEPNAAENGCDWIKTSSEGVALVKTVDSKGFRLHLDAAAMSLERENPKSAIGDAADVLHSFHVSERNLAPISTSSSSDHAAFADALRNVNFSGWASIEMIPEAYSLEVIEGALNTVAKTYG